MELNMNDKMTAYEVARRMGNKDSMLITELMALSNEMLIDLPQVPCNDGQIHKFLLRDSYPEAESHGYNMGVGSKATQTREVSEGLMMSSVYSHVDKNLAEASGDVAGLRNSEAEAFLLGMGLQQAKQMMYADKAKNAFEINGLATRIGKLKEGHAVDAGIIATLGTKPVTSIYLCALGPKQFHGIYRANSKGAGVNREDKGETQWDYGSGKLGPVLLERFSIEYGIAIEHPDSVYRICNVPVNAADWGGTPAARKENREALLDLILEVQKKLPAEARTTGIYCNRDVTSVIEKAARDLQTYIHPDKDPWGNPIKIVNGMRLRRMDVIKADVTEQVK